MASVVDICNIALAHLGDEASVSAIDPPDGSAQAGHCKRFYPIARDALIESHNWQFATKREPLALLSATPPANWSYVYAYPNCLRMIGVFPPDEVVPTAAIFADDERSLLAKPVPFEIEAIPDGTLVIYTNMENATAAFVVSISDTSKFSPLVVLAMARFLASLLAGPILKGTEGIKISEAHLKAYEQLDLPRAKRADATARYTDVFDKFIPSHLAARS